MRKILTIAAIVTAAAFGSGCSVIQIGTACHQQTGQAAVCK